MARSIIVDENGNAITGPLPSAYAKTIMDQALMRPNARSEVPQSEMMAADAAKPSAFGNPNVRLNPEPQQPETPPEPSMLEKFKSLFGSGDTGPSQTEMMNQGASAPSAFGNANARPTQPINRGGIGAILEATTPPAPTQTGVTPEATAEINRLADVRRGVPLAALERKMAKERMNITGPSVFDNPADVADLTAPKVPSDNSFDPDKGMEDILAQAEAFKKENFSDLPNYGPPGSERQDDMKLG
jgi:hypothetical protein